MTAVSYHQDKTVFRCVLNSSAINNFAAEARKRYENHRRWLQEKEYHLQLQKESQIKADEVARRAQARFQDQLRQRELQNRLIVKQWQQQKQQDELKKKNENLVLNLVKKKTQETECQDENELFQKWLQLKADQKVQKDFEHKQVEAKVKEEAQTKMIRKALAEISYQQWKKNATSREIVIPKNGFQIFSQKPAPVVLDDWVSYEPPQETQSQHAIGHPKLCTINSFRSERFLRPDESARSSLPRLHLDSSNWSLVPWSKRQGELRSRRSSTRTSPRRSTGQQSKDSKPPQKKKPPFR